MTLRTFVSALGVILALILTAVAVPTAWIDQNIVKEEGFVRIAGELGNDPEFQDRLATAAVGTFESSVDLPGPIQSLAADALRSAASGMQSWSDYPQAWEETVRNSHRLNFGAANQPEEAATTTALVLDISPLVRLIRDHFAEATRIRIDVPAESLVSLGGEPSHRQLVERVAAFAPLWWVAALGALISMLLALVARAGGPWCWSSSDWAAWRLLLSGRPGGRILPGGSGWQSVQRKRRAELFKQEFLTAAKAGFGEWILMAAVASGGVFVAGVIASVVSGRRGSRSASS